MAPHFLFPLVRFVTIIQADSESFPGGEGRKIQKSIQGTGFIYIGSQIYAGIFFFTQTHSGSAWKGMV